MVYLHYANRIEFLHNVVWGVHQGAYGGLSFGPDLTDLDLYDNILLSVNYTHTGGVYDSGRAPRRPQPVRCGHRPVAGQRNRHRRRRPRFAGIPDVEGSLVEGPRAEDFVPGSDSPAVDAGTAAVVGVTLPTTDFFGALRDDGLPDLGAIELRP